MSLLPSPAALVELTRYAAGQVVETVASAATVPARVLGVLSQTELLVSRISVLAERAESLIDRVERVTADAEETVGGAKAIVQRVDQVTTEAGQIVQSAAVITAGAGQIVQKADLVTAEAAGTSKVAKGLLEEYVPTLQRAAPLLARFVNDLTPEEVTAAIKMIDTLPVLRRHLTEDVMPLLGKLDQVGPDLHSLLEVTNDLHLAIVGMPGLKLLRRRGAERVAEEHQAEEK